MLLIGHQYIICFVIKSPTVRSILRYLTCKVVYSVHRTYFTIHKYSVFFLLNV